MRLKISRRNVLETDRIHKEKDVCDYKVTLTLWTLQDTFLEETFIFLSLFTEHEHAVYEEQSTYCET